jgi:hypothetical protein
MVIRLLRLAIILRCCGSTNASGGKTNIAVVSNKIKDAAMAAQSSVTKLAAETTSNDSNEYLYDLMVESITINDTKLSKSSKLPSRSPIVTSIPSFISDDDDDSSVDDNWVQIVTNDTADNFYNQTTIVPSPPPSMEATLLASTFRPTSKASSSSVVPTQPPSTYEVMISISNESTSMPTQATLTSIAPNTILEPSHFPTALHTFAPIMSKSSKAPIGKVSNPSVLDQDQGSITECPGQFNDTIEYHEFDVVSMNYVVYKCKAWPRSAYCNTFAPGSEYGEHGWTADGPCAVSSPSFSPTVDSGETSLSPNNLLPTMLPTAEDKAFTFSPTVVESIMLLPTSNSSTNESSKDDKVLSLNLPRIICDISISPGLTPTFEDKHVLLIAMTNTIFQILDRHLDKTKYEVDGISLSVHVSTKEGDNESVTSMIRVKADFTGKVTFAIGDGDTGAPSARELVDILLSHFQIDEFTKRLTSPLKPTRAAQDQIVKVNSVFFSLEDGMLLPVRVTNDNAVTFTDSPSPAEPADADDLELAVGVFALTAVGFFLTMVLLVAHSRKVDYDQDDPADFVPSSSNNRPVSATPTKKKQTGPQVYVPKINPFGEVDSISDVSDLSESPYTERPTTAHDIAPATPSLGIAAPNHRYFTGSHRPYADDASVDHDKEWKMRSCMLETP